MDFKSHLLKYLSEESVDKLLLSLGQKERHAALLNIVKMDDETFKNLFPNVIPHPFVKHAYLYDKDEYDLGKSFYHLLGCFYLQEPSAMFPSFFLDPKEDDIVLDLCAAPGGKSVQASFLMNNKGLIISNDISRQRCSSIVENIERLGIGNTIVTNNDFEKISYLYKNTFDKIILDAPCSGSGMMRKDSRMIDDWSYNKVLKNQEIQKSLILTAFDMLKEGGTMVYSTCSFSYEENEEVIAYLLKERNAKTIPLPKSEFFYVDNNLPYGVHLFPHLFEGEGHYICLIQKEGTLIKTKLNQEISKIKDVFISGSIGHTKRFGDTLFGLPSSPIKLKDLNIVRYGLKIGEFKKGYFDYDYHYSHFVLDFPNKITINEDDLKRYLRGETILSNETRAYVQIYFKNIPISFGKGDGKVIKNHFPKGLRHIF